MHDTLSSAEVHHGENQNKGNLNQCHIPLITQLTFDNYFSNIFSLIQILQLLQTMLAIYGFHSENIFGEKL